jgi:hypothetical protein
MRFPQQFLGKTSILHLHLSLTLEEVIMCPNQIGIHNDDIGVFGFSIFESNTGRFSLFVVDYGSDG